MLLDLGRAVSFILSMLSLYPVLLSAFFLPGSRWQDRLALSLLKVALAAGICFVSGFLFAFQPQTRPRMAQTITSTLPVQIFFWAMAAMAVLFLDFLVSGGVLRAAAVAESAVTSLHDPAEMTFRFNRRAKPNAFRSTMM